MKEKLEFNYSEVFLVTIIRWIRFLSWTPVQKLCKAATQSSSTRRVGIFCIAIFCLFFFSTITYWQRGRKNVSKWKRRGSNRRSNNTDGSQCAWCVINIWRNFPFILFSFVIRFFFSLTSPSTSLPDELTAPWLDVIYKTSDVSSS